MRPTLTGVIITIIFVIVGIVWVSSKITIPGYGAVVVAGMPTDAHPASLLSIISGGIADAIRDAVRAVFGGWFGWG